jgi:hypothetical protein
MKARVRDYPIVSEYEKGDWNYPLKNWQKFEELLPG